MQINTHFDTNRIPSNANTHPIEEGLAYHLNKITQVVSETAREALPFIQRGADFTKKLDFSTARLIPTSLLSNEWTLLNAPRLIELLNPDSNIEPLELFQTHAPLLSAMLNPDSSIGMLNNGITITS